MRMSKLLFAVPLCLPLLSPGLFPAPAGAATAPRAVEQAAARATAPTFLEGHLPAGTVGYVRIPNLWDLLSAPKGNVLSEAVGSAPYADALASLHEALASEGLAQMPEEARALVELFAVKARSSLELAVMSADQGGFSVLASLALDVAGPEDLNALLNQAAASEPMLEVMAPLDPSGSGAIAVAGQPLQLFLRDDGRLFALFGPPPAEGELADWVAALAPTPEHPMHPVARTVDESGHGLLLWLDAQGAMQTLQGMGMQQQVAMLQGMGLSEARSVVAGFGTSAGKGRLRVAVEMPRVGMRSLLPQGPTDLRLTTAGEPDLVLMLALPDAADLEVIEGTILASQGEEAARQYTEGKRALREELGFGVEDIFAALGPEAVVVFDQAGEYLALRVRDRALLQRILDGLVQRFELPYEERQVAGQNFRHLTVPGELLQVEGMESGDEEMPEWVENAANLPTHLYWVDDGDYLLMSSVPQTLMDRAYESEQVALADWLRERQRVEGNGSLLLLSGRIDDLPRRLYDLNLQVLEVLGDLMGRPVDLFAFPSTRELGLPDSGAYTLRLESSPQAVAVELTYEASPGDVLLSGGGMMAAALVGITAAVALPAYQEYQARRYEYEEAPEAASPDLAEQVAEGMAQADELKVAVVDFYTENGRYPNEAEVAGAVIEPDAPEVDRVFVVKDTGQVVVVYALEELGDEPYVVFSPSLDPQGNVTWECASNIEAQHLPPGCN